MKFATFVSGLAAVSSVAALPTWFSKRENLTEGMDGAASGLNDTSSAMDGLSGEMSNLTSSLTNRTILLTNDDGWAATNIRATYRDLKAAGYDVIMVAPVAQRSGFGGQFALPTSANLTADGGFGYPAEGAPSWGHEEDDMNVWYFNGTPSSCVAFGLNYVIPTYFDNKTVDLVVAGPNEGLNLSPGMYTLSGTIGATYSAVNRGYPAIAFSGSNSNNSFFKDDEDKESDEMFPPNIYAKLIVEFVEQLFESKKNNPHLLPLTTGINVNLPAVGSQNEDCTDPDWVYTRLNGPDSMYSDLVYNETQGLFVYEYGNAPQAEVCTAGDCTLPSEGWIFAQDKCLTTVSLFSIDYDAAYDATLAVAEYLSPLFE